MIRAQGSASVVHGGDLTLHGLLVGEAQVAALSGDRPGVRVGLNRAGPGGCGGGRDHHDY